MPATEEPLLYEYKPLEGFEPIRLIRLTPAPESYLGVDCEIINTNLHSQPESTNLLQYEAMSWSWGVGGKDHILRVHEDYKVKHMPITRNLFNALRALRWIDRVRTLWVDAICINQNDLTERNREVARMDQIYFHSKRVCIWLGDSDEKSTKAINFIKTKLLKVWEFDTLIDDRDMVSSWLALIELMKRPWFSRRWVVQEIVLSPHEGEIYCGNDSISWGDFADAVSLFVEVESATHRLSDVVKRNEIVDHIPDFFGDVSSLGAALLVESTSNLFRKTGKGEQQPISTLEELVSRLAVFEASQPRDTIYALLAICKDTIPHHPDTSPRVLLPILPPGAESSATAPGPLPVNDNSSMIAQIGASGMSEEEREKRAHKIMEGIWLKKRYSVNYGLTVVQVYQEFIEFAIRNANQKRALDILCRPWAPPVRKLHEREDFKMNPSEAYAKPLPDDDEEIPLPSWISDLTGAAFEIEEHPSAGLRMERQNADPLVGLPGPGQPNYSAAGDLPPGLGKHWKRFKRWDDIERPPDQLYPAYSIFAKGFILGDVTTVGPIASGGNLPYKWVEMGGWKNTETLPPDEFWRTLVAGRGPGGRNPPTFYPRACKETIKFKAKTKSKFRGTLDCKRLINEGQCTIVAEFLRRLQAVIWNRKLFETRCVNTKGVVTKRLGLGDNVERGQKVCILYGLSVPVILEEVDKDDDQLQREREILWKDWKNAWLKTVSALQAIFRYRLAEKKKREQLLQESSPAANLIPQSSDDQKENVVSSAGGANPETNTGHQSNVAQAEADPQAEGGQQPAAEAASVTNQIREQRRAADQLVAEKKKREIKQTIYNEVPRKYYRLVGACYIHGVMDGEAPTLPDRNSDIIFDIR